MDEFKEKTDDLMTGKKSTEGTSADNQDLSVADNEQEILSGSTELRDGINEEEVNKENEFNALVAEKQQALDELTNRMLRLQADFDNFRRRSRQETAELSTMVKAEVVQQFLPTLDNFSRAVQNSGTQDLAGLRAGVEMIYRQYIVTLEKIGIEMIEAVGTTFNPELHEAVMRLEDANQPDGVIVEELQKGYTLAGKVIRPSMVKVVCNP